MQTTGNGLMMVEAYCPVGTYDGVWSGYCVTWKSGHNVKYQAATKDGVRSTNCPCRVTVLPDRTVSVETINRGKQL